MTAGELWRRRGQIGKETVAGTPVAATRVIYPTDIGLTSDVEMNIPAVMTGQRYTNVDARPRATQVSGSYAAALSFADIVEMLLIGLNGGVTPTTVGTTGKQWAFTPGLTLDSATVEYFDGARNWQAAGVRANTLGIDWDANGDAAVTADLFGTAFAQVAASTGLAERIPEMVGGWESKLYLDAFGAAPGTTNIATTMLSGSFSMGNNLGRKYFSDNTRNAGRIISGNLEATMTVLMEGVSPTALAEYTNRNAGVKRLVRVELGNNDVIGAGPAKKLIWIDFPCIASGVDLGQDDESTRAYEMTYTYIYDPTNAFPFRITVINDRATAW